MSESPSPQYNDHRQYNQTPTSAEEFFSSHERYEQMLKHVSQPQERDDEQYIQKFAEQLADSPRMSVEILEALNIGDRLEVLRAETDVRGM